MEIGTDRPVAFHFFFLFYWVWSLCLALTSITFIIILRLRHDHLAPLIVSRCALPVVAHVVQHFPFLYIYIFNTQCVYV